jgi:hypothetical protein
MALVEGYFDEVGYWGAICTHVQWDGSTLIADFSKGFAVGGSSHPLAGSLKLEDPCRLIFRGVVESKLKISEALDEHNSFQRHHYERNDLPHKKEDVQYNEYFMEGTMKAMDVEGWFTWDIVAEEFIVDDLK